MTKLKILIAEDDRTTQALYQHAFPVEQFDCRIVDNGELAMLSYDEAKPDIMLLDISMPIRNGFKVLEEIRKQKKDTATAIVMVSSVTEKDEIIACARHGIQGYIIKPFRVQELAAKVRRIHSEFVAQT